jgi:hypothetical protein
MLHVLEHLEQESFTVPGGLFAGLGLTDLLLEHGDHVAVDVQRVNRVQS